MNSEDYAYCNNCGHVGHTKEIPNPMTESTEYVCESCESRDTSLADYVSGLPNDPEPGDYESGLVH